MRKLIDELIREGYLRTPGIIKAFRKIDRADFIPSAGKDALRLQAESEINAPLPTAAGQTISQPLTVAVMLELLQPALGDRVLDIGSGSGWTAALLAYLVGEKGRVTSLERLIELKEFAEKNINKYGLENISFILGNGWNGYRENAPYEIIHVAAAVTSIPKELTKQLSINGRMIIPVGEGRQDLVLVKKNKNGDIEEKRHSGYVFVPLIDRSAA